MVELVVSTHLIILIVQYGPFSYESEHSSDTSASWIKSYSWEIYQLFLFSIESDLVKLAQEVLDLVRGQFNKQTFAEVYAKVQKKAHEKRETRKRKLAVEVSPLTL